jgi:methylmalonyl-CoA mutase
VDAARIAQAVSDAGNAVAAVICGTDARYAAEASEVVEAARAAGVSHVYLAGPEKAVSDTGAAPAATSDTASKPYEYLTAKIDAIAALSALLTRLGA